jgi:hypothetical protein
MASDDPYGETIKGRIGQAGGGRRAASGWSRADLDGLDLDGLDWT